MGCSTRAGSGAGRTDSSVAERQVQGAASSQTAKNWHQRIAALPRPPGSPRGAKSSEPLITRFQGGVAGISREESFEFLLNTDVFAASKVGFGMETPKQVIAFRKLLAEPDAKDIFTDLEDRARLAGQMYALCGLRITDRPSFDRLIKKYRSSDEMVRTIQGCEGGGGTVRYLIESHQPGNRDIQGGVWSTEFSGQDERPIVQLKPCN